MGCTHLQGKLGQLLSPNKSMSEMLWRNKCTLVDQLRERIDGSGRSSTRRRAALDFHLDSLVRMTDRWVEVPAQGRALVIRCGTLFVGPKVGRSHGRMKTIFFYHLWFLV